MLHLGVTGDDFRFESDEDLEERVEDLFLIGDDIVGIRGKTESACSFRTLYFSYRGSPPVKGTRPRANLSQLAKTVSKRVWEGVRMWSSTEGTPFCTPCINKPPWSPQECHTIDCTSRRP